MGSNFVSSTLVFHRQTDRQTDRQAGKQTDKQTVRQRNRQTQTDRQGEGVIGRLLLKKGNQDNYLPSPSKSATVGVE